MDDDRVEEKGRGIGGKMAQNDECLVDVEEGEDGDDRSRKLENSKVCRICHFGKELELIKLGCDCKGELGSSHQHCAEAWFAQKGDRICEICGKMAKNVEASADDGSIFMMEWNEMRMVAATLDDSHESSPRCKQIVCNLTLAALLIVFLLSWLLRAINIT